MEKKRAMVKSKKYKGWEKKKVINDGWDGVDVSFPLPAQPLKPKSIFGKILFISWAVSVLPLLSYIIQKIKNQWREF